MNLAELITLVEDRASMLSNKVAALKAERKTLLRTHAASSIQSSINPAYASHVKRLDAAIIVATHELAAELAKPNIEREIRDADRKHAETFVRPEPGDAIKAGAKHWLDLAAKYGDEHKLNVAIKQAATKQTQNGLHLLDMNSLGREFGVGANAMYRRINQMTSLQPLKRWYPKPK